MVPGRHRRHKRFGWQEFGRIERAERGTLRPMTLTEVLISGAVGLAAGILGGLAGVGGSILILPSLAFLFGSQPDVVQHLYMAAAMTVNLVVAVPSALRHRAAGAVRGDLVRKLLPITAISLALGVLASNCFRGWQLQILLAGFLLVYCGLNIHTLLRGPQHGETAQETVTPARLLVSGGLTGLTAGLLGLGGGVLQVPLLQMLCKVKLRQAIATSSAVICLTAMIGAVLKLWSLPGLYAAAGLDGHAAVWRALILAGCMAPTAVIGARFGASLTHRLPLACVRGVITVMLIVAAIGLGRKGFLGATQAQEPTSIHSTP